MLFRSRPVFANMILADEINRTPPKTQAALLEAMQEHQVTAAGVAMSWKNHFLFSLRKIRLKWKALITRGATGSFHVQCRDELFAGRRQGRRRRQTTARNAAAIESLFTGEDALKFHELVRQVPIAENLIRYAVRLTAASRPHQTNAQAFVNDWVSWGAGAHGQFRVDRCKSPRCCKTHARFRR